MATTGEECLHQKPIHSYFDSGYDLIFDAAIEHYCAHFRKAVIPAQACGTCCPAFQSLQGIPSSSALTTIKADEALTNDVRVRAFLKQRLKEVCDELEANAKYLELQVPTREQRWREADAWLSRQEAQPEMLGHELANAERDLSVALGELQRVRRQLELVKAGLRRVQDVEHLWLQQERFEREVQHARQAQQRIRDLLNEREKREAEQNQLYERWEDALKRIPLLRKLRVAVVHRVKTRLAGSQQCLSDSDVERIVRILQHVSAYSTDEVPISILEKVVQRLLQEATVT